MNAETLAQPFVFLATLYGGIVAGFLFDLAEAIGKAGERRVSLAAEIVLLVLAFGIAVLILWYATGVALRLYQFIGLAAGFGVYRAGIGAVIGYVCAHFGRRHDG